MPQTTPNIPKFIAQARAQGYSDDEIEKYVMQKVIPDPSWLQKFAMNKNVPIYGGLLAGGITGTATGGALAIPGAVAGGAAAYGAQDALKKLTGVPTVTTDEGRLGGQRGAAITSGISQGVGDILGWAAGKVLSPVMQKVKGFWPKSIAKSARGVKFDVGRQIDDLIKQYADDPFNEATKQQILEGLNQTKNSVNFRGNPDAVAAINDVIKEVSGINTLESANRIGSFEFAKEALTKAGLPKYTSNVAQTAEMASKRYAGPLLTEYTEKVVPGLEALKNSYGSLAKLGGDMAHPGSGLLYGGLASILSSPLGPGVSVPAGTAATVAFNPYLNLMARRLGFGTLNLARPFAELGTSKVMQNYMGQ